ncbi:MAG: hypothetical protein J0M08_08000 [Bacteroidetes bacterium]|nr:hypothetical protein [Bacteroidota bacterium]
MKNLFFATIILIILNPLKAHSQSVKTKHQSFRYEILPPVVLPKNYTTYKVETINESSDGIPLNPKFIYVKEEYLTGLKNTTMVAFKTGVIAGGSIISKTNEQKVEDNTTASLQISILFNNLEIVDKKDFSNQAINPQTATTQGYFTYKLFFKFPYRIRIKDVDANKYILDTLINTQKSTLFPCDYRYDGYGNKTNFPGYTNKPDLDIDYNKNGKDLYANSKMILAQTCMNEVKEILKNKYGYDWRLQTVHISRVKSKSPKFDVCDTISGIMDKLFDSISYNTKNEKHLNWHTVFVKNEINKVAPIWEKMISSNYYLEEFKDPLVRDEFIYKTKRNLIVAYLFQDDFEKALKLYYEVEPLTAVKFLGGTTPDEHMKTLLEVILREKSMYSLHKKAYSYQ